MTCSCESGSSPPYSPELNLVESLWKKIKYEWL
ncbi:MAG: transposase, partial [Methylomonas sp.]